MHDDLVGRDFTAPDIDVTWLTDITEHPTGEGKLYMCDQELRREPDRRLLDGATDDLRPRRRSPAQRHHASVTPGHDRALRQRQSQTRSRKYVLALHAAGLVGSMGRVGACADNAAMEPFFALLLNNVLNRQRRTTATNSDSQS